MLYQIKLLLGGYMSESISDISSIVSLDENRQTLNEKALPG